MQALNDVLDEGEPLHPLEIQRKTVHDLRQIGLGTCGLADMLIKLGISYGDAGSLDIIDAVYRHIAYHALWQSTLLAQFNGAYPECNNLAIRDSSFVKALNLDKDFIKDIEDNGIYNSQLLTCAPAGSIATMLGVSTGIEPIYAMHYTRTTKSLEGKDKVFEVYTPIAKQWLECNPGKELPEYFIESKDINPLDRIKVQGTIQKYIDASISSTINLPKEATVEDVYNIYINACKHGLKGVTVYRNGCAREGILNTEAPKEIKPTPKYDYIMPISRKKMGDTYGCTACKKSACGTLYVTCNKDKDGNFVELFTHTSKGGVCQANLNAVTRGISLALRSGVKIDEIIDQLKGIHCPACSNAKAKGQKIDGLSCPDIIAKVMQNFIKGTKDSKPKEVKEESTDKCPECGSPLIREGGCVQCTSCGWSRCG